MKRAEHSPELLDGALDPDLLRGNLRDLARINRWLGGVDLSRRALRESGAALWPQPRVSILDVGTGGADIPLDVIRTWGFWPDLSVTAIDARAEVVAAARALTPELDRTPQLALALGDGTQLEYPDREFDIAHASLVLHHFDPPEARELLREMARVARAAVVINDLTRGALQWLGALGIAACCTRNAYTRHDAPLSVRRAYTLDELRDLLAAAELRPVRTFRGLLGHRYAVIARPTAGRA